MFIKTASCTTVDATSPVNPVEAGGILSLHCQIRDLSKDNEVKILRTVAGKTERLTAEKDINSEAGDRVFLAIRTMHDGTTVYFLSIMGVTVDDAGSYSCQVVNEGVTATEVVAVQSVEIGIIHFPDETEPLCESNHPTTVLAGTELILNCSSTKSNPLVNIKWTRTGTDATLPSLQDGVGAERIYKFMKFRPSMEDNKSIFMCQISSPYFPDKIQTCHIGPLEIIPNNGAVDMPSTQSIQATDKKTPKVFIPKTDSSTDCETVCTPLTSPVVYWVIATIAAGTLSVIFMIIGMVLFIKMCNLRSSLPMEDMYTCSPPLHDKIYVELETNKPRDKLYMALDTRERPVAPTMFTAPGRSTLDKTMDQSQTYILHK